jgi:DNA-binding response OmpR family regulator
MGKILVCTKLFEIRELILQDLAAEGHTVVSTGNPVLMQDLLMTLVPDLVLLDFHLDKIHPWKMMQLIQKKSPGVSVLPFSAYTNGGGEVRMVIAHRDGGENLSFQAFKSMMNTFLDPKTYSRERKSQDRVFSPES